MSRFSRLIPTLQQTFPGSDKERAYPSEISDYVQLVHPALGPLVRHHEARHLQVSGTPGGAGLFGVADLPVVPEGRVHYYPIASCFFSTAGAGLAHTGGLFLRQLNTTLASSIMGTQDVGSGSGFLEGITLNLNRPILCPPGWFLRGFFAGVAPDDITVVIEAQVIEFFLAETPPSI